MDRSGEPSREAVFGSGERLVLVFEGSDQLSARCDPEGRKTERIPIVSEGTVGIYPQIDTDWSARCVGPIGGRDDTDDLGYWHPNLSSAVGWAGRPPPVIWGWTDCLGRAARFFGLFPVVHLQGLGPSAGPPATPPPAANRILCRLRRHS